MNTKFFFHQIKELPSLPPRGPPLGEGVKAGIAKCHFAGKPRESRAFTDIFQGFPPTIECHVQILARKEMPLARKESNQQITVKLPKSQVDSLKKYGCL